MHSPTDKWISSTKYRSKYVATTIYVWLKSERERERNRTEQDEEKLPSISADITWKISYRPVIALMTSSGLVIYSVYFYDSHKTRCEYAMCLNERSDDSFIHVTCAQYIHRYIILYQCWARFLLSCFGIHNLRFRIFFFYIFSLSIALLTSIPVILVMLSHPLCSHSLSYRLKFYLSLLPAPHLLDILHSIVCTWCILTYTYM